MFNDRLIVEFNGEIVVNVTLSLAADLQFLFDKPIIDAYIKPVKITIHIEKGIYTKFQQQILKLIKRFF